MRVLICGSRTWPSSQAIFNRIAELPLGSIVVHGNAPGADRQAHAYALLQGLSVEPWIAEWNKYGKRAGFLRNQAMIESKPDLVIAFQHRGSRGTQHTIDLARKYGIPVEVHSDNR